MTGRILVVDDVLPNVKLLEAKLTAEYFEVVTASDGPSALAAAAECAPDVILLDVMMPGMDGFEVCRRLKHDPDTRHVPVVMVTALSELSDRVRGLEAGAEDFLSKPVNDVALFARVRSLVRLKLMMDELHLRQSHVGAGEVFDKSALDEDVETAGARVLLVESHGATAHKISDCLLRDEHQVDRARTVVEGLEMSAQENYDMFIVGLEIAGEDGLRLCSNLRSQEQTRQVPILLMLEDMDLPRLAKGLDLGVTDYLIKPVDPNELLARSRTQIRRRRYHERLRDMLHSSVSMAYTDALTGLYNRRYLNANLDRKILEIAETAKPISLIIFDIDHFKKVNDVHGHAVGDEVLRVLADRVRDSVRDIDMVARYGGEEFVILMPDSAPAVAEKVAERLLRQVESEAFVGDTCGIPLPVTVSIGVATTYDPMEEATEFLKRADVALYEAKNAGRNCIKVSPGVSEGAPEQAEPRQAVAGV